MSDDALRPSPPDPSDRSEVARSFFGWVHGLIARGDGRMRDLGRVEDAYTTGAAAVARQVRHSAWHMTIYPSWSQVRAAQPFAELRRRTNVDLRYLTTPLSLHRLPLLASHHHPYLRVGPVVDSMLVLDRSKVYVGLPHATSADGSVYESTDTRVVASAVRAYDAAWQEAEPVGDPEVEPQFTRRHVQVAFHLSAGATDREIARALLVSERTVSAEVGELVRRLGARSRTHAIGLITGAHY